MFLRAWDQCFFREICNIAATPLERACVLYAVPTVMSLEFDLVKTYNLVQLYHIHLSC